MAIGSSTVAVKSYNTVLRTYHQYECRIRMLMSHKTYHYLSRNKHNLCASMQSQKTGHDPGYSTTHDSSVNRPDRCPMQVPYICRFIKRVLIESESRGALHSALCTSTQIADIDSRHRQYGQTLRILYQQLLQTGSA